MSDPPALLGLDHVQLAAPAGCEPEARRFFGELLGLAELPKPAGLAARGGAWFRCGDQQVHVGVTGDFEPAAKAHPAFRVADAAAVEALRERLSRAGVAVRDDDELPGVRRFYAADPWGNRLEFIAAPALPAALEAYLEGLVERVHARLGHELVAVILSGSAATGSFVPDSSDVDVIVIARGAPAEPVLLALASDLDHAVLPCPARKLELVVYPRDVARRPSRRPRFALNLNTGAGRRTHRSLDPGEEPSHWFLLDLALTRERGRSLLGPPPETLVGPVPRAATLQALAASLDWHDAHESEGANAVLNACRAWLFAVEGRLGSKDEGAAWALPRVGDRETVDAALAAHRSGAGAPLPPDRVASVVGEARAAVAAALG